MNVKIIVSRYIIDNRTIPVAGNENKGLELIPDTALFSVQNGNVSYSTPADEGSVSIGGFIQYQMNFC